MFVEDKKEISVLVSANMSGKITRLVAGIFLAFAAGLYAVQGFCQTVAIPDNNFRQCLITSYPSIFDSNNDVIISQASSVTSIQCSASGISDLSGIEVFSNVTKLQFDRNNIAALPDLSNLTVLTTMDFSGNQLTSLPDLSQNVDLQNLYFAGNNFSVFPEIASKANITMMDFQINNLKTLPDLSDFKSLIILTLNLNPLEELPSFDQLDLKVLGLSGTQLPTLPDLSTQVNLISLDFSNNPQLTEWPKISNCLALQVLRFNGTTISTIPDLSKYTNLSGIVCSQSQLEKLPAGLSALTELDLLACQGNKLTSLPDLSNTKIGTTGSQLDVSNNQLTFEDLIPVVVSKEYGSLSYGSQTLPAEDNTVVKVVGDRFTLDIGIDKSVADNTYSWYHDDVLLQTTNTSSLIINNLKTSDAGVYRCKITNARITDLEIDWGITTLSVCEKEVNTNDFTATVSVATCAMGGVIDLTAIGNGSFTNTVFTLTENSSGNVIPSSLPEISNIPPGNYTLVFVAGVCNITWPQTLTVLKDPACNQASTTSETVFSPNHDGVADEIYIASPGTAKIYDRSGVLVKELPIPATWDGTDESNRPLPMGTYIVKCSTEPEFVITIVK